MHQIDVVLLLTALFAVACCSYLLTWVAKWVAPKLGFLDSPDGTRKLHVTATPSLGGAAIFATLLAVFLIARQVYPNLLGSFPELESFLTWLTVSGCAIWLVGVADDRWSIPPRRKLCLQVLACLPFALGLPASSSIHLFSFHIEMGAVAGTAFTLLWLVACANAVNLMDGMDGLASTIGVVALATFAFLAMLGGQTHMAVISLLACGAVLGFLIHNWPPARIFLGDSGSLLIGFLMGAIALEANFKKTTGFALAVPLLVLGLPVLDTFVAIARRKLRGKGFAEADREHIHHCLQRRGWTAVQTVAAIAGISLFMSAGAILSAFLATDLIALLTYVVIVAAVVSCRLFGYDEALLAARHVQAASRFFIDSAHGLKRRNLIVRMQHSADEVGHDGWEAICRQLAPVGTAQIELACYAQPGGQLLSEANWEGQKAVAHGSQWQYQHSMVRDDGNYIVISATGGSQQQAPRLDHLHYAFEILGRQWVVAESSAKLPLSGSRGTDQPGHDDQRRAA